MGNRQWFNVVWFLLLIVFMSCFQNAFYERDMVANAANFVLFFITPAMFVGIIQLISRNMNIE